MAEGTNRSAARQRSVERLLQESIVASASAENRALKRRVRQRLHKRLGAMLPPEEFEEATQRFRDMETATKGNEEYHCEEDFSNYSPWFVMDGMVIPPWIQALPQGQFGMENTWYEAYDTSEQCLDWWCDGPCDGPYSVSCGQHQAIASLASSPSPASSVAMSSKGCCGDSGQSTEADSQASDDMMLSLDDTRRLPVARTFLHFDTRSVVPHRRSKSL
mmetsp:Transcript_9452/g.16204  ORF Transcript_9452/g.16204 Transcript_9452/m.16204 type:complete len:218 (-) Transcript_9452:129-782(-)